MKRHLAPVLRMMFYNAGLYSQCNWVGRCECGEIAEYVAIFTNLNASGAEYLNAALFCYICAGEFENPLDFLRVVDARRIVGKYDPRTTAGDELHNSE